MGADTLTTQMNEKIFLKNLSTAVDKIKKARNISSNIVKFVIEPMEEHGKMLDGVISLWRLMDLSCTV